MKKLFIIVLSSLLYHIADAQVRYVPVYRKDTLPSGFLKTKEQARLDSLVLRNIINLNTAARHTHSNLTALNNVSGPNTGDETGATIKTKLEALSGTNRLDASAIKNLPSGGSTTATVYNIKDYLATTGSADNSTSINAAINTASAAGGGIVFVPEGVWIIKAAYRDTATLVTPKGIILKSNVVLQGAGPGSVIKLSNPPSGAAFNTTTLATNTVWWHMISGVSVSEAGVKNLTLDGNLSNQINTTLNPYTNPHVDVTGGTASYSGTNLETDAISFVGGSSNKVEGVKVVSTAGYGVMFANSLSGIVQNCDINDALNGGVGFYGTSKYGKAFHNHIRKSYSDGIRIQADYCEASYNDISYTRVNPVGGVANFAGIYAEAAKQPVITANTLHDNSSFGIDFWNGGRTDAIGASVQNNKIFQNRNGGIRAFMSYSNVSGNTIWDNGADSAGVSDAVTYRNGGINPANSIGSTFSNNHIRDERGNQAYGFYIEGSSDKNQYIGNYVQGGTALFNTTVSTSSNELIGNTYLSAGGAITLGGGVSSGGGGGPVTDAMYADLYANFEFEQSSGNFTDNSGNGFTLTKNNGATTATGKINLGASLDGTNDYLSGSNLLNQSDQPGLTITMWIKPTASGVILGKWGTSSAEYDYLITYDASLNKIVWYTYTGGAAVAVDLPYTASGGFDYIMFKQSATSKTMAVNNGTPVVAALSSPQTAGTAPLYVGSYQSVSNYTQMGIDMLKMWRRTLSSAEITYDYNAGAGRIKP